VAKVLQEQQSRQGDSSIFRHVIDSTLRAEPLSSPLHTVAAGIDEYFLKDPSFMAPISVLRERTTPLGPLGVGGYDVVHLHGLAGTLHQKDRDALQHARKIVWTLHDMNPFTGACHYSLGCEKFSSGCTGCPAVRKIARPTVAQALQLKAQWVSQLKDLTLVAPSSWLATQAMASNIFAGRHVVVQANPINPLFCEDPDPADRTGESFSIVAVAQSLDDPLKNIESTVSAFHQARQHNPEMTLNLVGHGGQEFKDPGITVHGELTALQLKSLFAHTDALVVSSLAENAPLVIAEAASQGVMPVVSRVGGMPEMVTQVGQGKSFAEPRELKALLLELASAHSSRSPADRSKLRASTLSTFSPQSVATAYGKVYS